MFDFSADQLAVINLALSEAHYNYSVELDKIKKNKSMLFGKIGDHPNRKKELKKLIVIIDSIEEYLKGQ